MISLNDVLLAASNIPVDDPIAEIWGRGLQSGYKIIEYTGSLPITITADGNALFDYRIYGADGGVGEATENLFDPENLEIGGIINHDGSIAKPRRNGRISTYVDVTGASSVTLTQDRLTEPLSDQYMTIGCWDENKNFIPNSRVYAYVDKNRPDTRISVICILPSGTKYIRAGVLLNHNDDDIDSVHAMLNFGSTARPYEPYGYKLPMTVIDNLAPPLSQWIDGYLTIDGNIAAASITLREKASDFIEVKPNTQYVFGIEGDAFPQGATEVAWVAACFYRDDQTFIRRLSTNKNSPYTFLTSSETKYVRLSYRSYGKLWEPRLSESSFSTPVYIGENQLDAIGEYKDYVDKASGKIVRCIKEYTFTGKEAFLAAYGYAIRFVKPKFNDANSDSEKITCFSNFFNAIPNSTINDFNLNAPDGSIGFRRNEDEIVLKDSTKFTTPQECINYLKSQYDNGTPVKFWYVLEIPVEEDPPVPLPEIPTIDGTTIIDYDGDPKPSQMYVKYKGKG